MRPFIVAATLALLLTGCTTPGDTAGPPVDGAAAQTIPTDDRAPVNHTPVRIDAPFHWEYTSGAPVTWLDFYSKVGNGVGVPVHAGATNLSASAEWTCSTGMCTAELALYDPNTEQLSDPTTMSARARQTGDGTAAVDVTAPETGEWQLIIHAESPTAQQVDGMFHIYIGYGG